MVIGIDLDGVVFDTLGRFRQWCSGEKISNFCDTWMVCDLKNLVPEHFDKIHDTFRQPEFIQTIGFMPRAKRAIREMLQCDHHQIKAISGRAEEVSAITRSVLAGVLEPQDIYLVGWKNRAQAKVKLCQRLGIKNFVEDDPKVAQALEAVGIKVYLFDQSYNQDLEGIERVHSWGEIRSKFRELN